MSQLVTSTPARREALNESTVWQVYARRKYMTGRCTKMLLSPVSLRIP